MTPLSPKKRDWTVLYYGGGVNNLEPDIRKAWANLEVEDLPENVDTFVRHVDQDGRARDIHIGSDGQREIRAAEQVDSSNPETLADFLRRGVSQYPAEHYLVVVSSHGRGAEGVVEDDRADSIMRPHQLKKALEEGKKANSGRPLDAVMFDACRMAAVEVAAELSGSALVSIASMDNIASGGYDLGKVISVASRSENGRELGERLVGELNEQQLDAINSLSAIDLNRVEGLTSAWSRFSRAVGKVDQPGLDALGFHLKRSRRNRPSPITEYGNRLLADSILATPESDNTSALELWLENEEPGEAVAMVSFCSSVLSDDAFVNRYPDLADAAIEVLEAHNHTVLEHRAQDTAEDPGGLTVTMPLKNKKGPLYHSSLVFAESTGWESAYNKVLPDGEEFKREKSWLESELEGPAGELSSPGKDASQTPVP